MDFMPSYIRSGGISPAYAVSVLLELIMRLSNHVSIRVVLRNYLDHLVPESLAERVLFSRLPGASN